jgi:hypothetical protein
VTRTSGEKLAYRAARGAPQPVPGLVRRSRLFDRLDGSVDARVTLISAPAGSGKTQLVRSWLLGAPIAGPVAWYSVERGERAGCGDVQVARRGDRLAALVATRPAARAHR